MKKISLCLLLALIVFGAKAQNAAVKFANIDTSPLDVLYYPLNVVKAKDNSTPVIKVVYSRPAKKGREVFGVLEQLEKVWRLGANENTEVTFYKAVTIGTKKIKAGTYSLFAIPSKDKWTIIVNKQINKWGAFSYDQAKDVVRTDVSISRLDKPVENFSMTFTDLVGGTNLVMAWDNTQVMLPILFK